MLWLDHDSVYKLFIRFSSCTYSSCIIRRVMRKRCHILWIGAHVKQSSAQIKSHNILLRWKQRHTADKESPPYNGHSKTETSVDKAYRNKHTNANMNIPDTNTAESTRDGQTQARRHRAIKQRWTDRGTPMTERTWDRKDFKHKQNDIKWQNSNRQT